MQTHSPSVMRTYKSDAIVRGLEHAQKIGRIKSLLIHIR